MATLHDTTWNATLYDDKHNFVFKYGEDVVQLLAPEKGERILDLGCGTGYLTNLIAQAGARVVGIDNSVAMIQRAHAADRIPMALRPGGRLVLEMGGKGNVEEIVVATRKVLTRHGYYSNAATQLWYFPSVGEYTTLLEKRGFRIQ